MNSKEIQNRRKKRMTKKALKAFNAAQRQTFDFNSGTRTFKSAKDYNRQAQKNATRKEAENEQRSSFPRGALERYTPSAPRISSIPHRSIFVNS